MTEDDDGAQIGAEEATKDATKHDKNVEKNTTDQVENAEEATLSFDCELCDFKSNVKMD